MNKYKTFGLGLAIGAVGIGGFFLLNKFKPHPTIIEATAPSWRVSAQVIELATGIPKYEGFGVVENPDILIFKARMVADVVAVNVREGQHVPEGAILAILDRTGAEIRLTQAKANLADTSSTLFSLNVAEEKDHSALLLDLEALSLYEQRLARASDLKIRKLASEQALDEARQAVVSQKLQINRRELALETVSAKRNQLQIRIKHFEAELRAAKRDFNSTTIQATTSGQIDSVHIVRGDRVKENQNLITFAPESSREIRVQVPLTVGNRLAKTLETEAPVLAATGRGNQLKLLRVSGVLRTSTGTLDAFFASDDPLPVLGTLLPISIDLLPENGVVALPTDALYGGNLIYRITADSKLEGISIENIGQRTQTGKTEVLVRSPELSTNDTILVSRLPAAITGLKVEIVW